MTHLEVAKAQKKQKITINNDHVINGQLPSRNFNAADNTIKQTINIRLCLSQTITMWQNKMKYSKTAQTDSLNFSSSLSSMITASLVAISSEIRQQKIIYPRILLRHGSL